VSVSHIETRYAEQSIAPSSASGFIPALDGLRAIAILWVILHNAFAFTLGTTERIKVLSVLANAGWVGVQLFFALSGYLITRNLLRSRDDDNYYRSFYMRRALRILPLCYTFLFVSLIAIPFFWPYTEAGRPLQAGHLWVWAFLLNWSQPLGWPSYGVPHFWSLAVEEQFYLVWPFVVQRLRSNSLLKFCALLVICALCFRTFLFMTGGNADMIYEFTLSRMDALALGAMVAFLLHEPKLRMKILDLRRFVLPAAGLVFVFSAAITDFFARDIVATQTLGQSTLAIACALLVLGVILERDSRHAVTTVLSAAPMQAIGRYSFGMYVLHFPIAHALTGFAAYLEPMLGPLHLPVWYILIVLLTLGAAWISYHAIELPFLELKKRFGTAKIAA
jgi:peptidoglycan/LPS O-acetylase OafA/YrhL